jgi:hypothetical protein
MENKHIVLSKYYAEHSFLLDLYSIILFYVEVAEI